MQKEWKRLAPLAIAGTTPATAGMCLWQKPGAGLPDGAVSVGNFAIAHDAGQWYEIAGFDDRFEKGLQNLTAYYALNPDGSIRMLNRRQDSFLKEWEERKGKTKFIHDEATGRLNVSFFRPFQTAYPILAPDDQQYTLIAGNDPAYRWSLSRNPEPPKNLKQNNSQQAAATGGDSSRRSRTKQTINHA